MGAVVHLYWFFFYLLHYTMLVLTILQQTNPIFAIGQRNGLSPTPGSCRYYPFHHCLSHSFSAIVGFLWLLLLPPAPMIDEIEHFQVPLATATTTTSTTTGLEHSCLFSAACRNRPVLVPVGFLGPPLLPTTPTTPKMNVGATMTTQQPLITPEIKCKCLVSAVVGPPLLPITPTIPQTSICACCRLALAATATMTTH